jgi:hypothetical protein
MFQNKFFGKNIMIYWMLVAFLNCVLYNLINFEYKNTTIESFEFQKIFKMTNHPFSPPTLLPDLFKTKKPKYKIKLHTKLN